MGTDLAGNALVGQLDIISGAIVCIAGCGRLEQGAAYSATSVPLLQVVDN